MDEWMYSGSGTTEQWSTNWSNATLKVTRMADGSVFGDLVGPDGYNLGTPVEGSSPEEVGQALMAAYRDRFGTSAKLIVPERLFFDEAERARYYLRPRHAHDSGDGERIFHCPFCGSGNVTGRSDGSISCGFCFSSFTVQVQPTHPFMPQTVDGQPYMMPGMPGNERRQQEGDVPAQPPEAPHTAPPGAPGSLDAAFEQLLHAPPQVAAARFYVTADQTVLPEGAYLRHLALVYADDRKAVLPAVREAAVARDRC